MKITVSFLLLLLLGPGAARSNLRRRVRTLTVEPNLVPENPSEGPLMIVEMPSENDYVIESSPSEEEQPDIVVHFADWLAPGYGGPTASPTTSAAPSAEPSSSPLETESRNGSDAQLDEPEIVVHFEDWLAPGYGGPTAAPSTATPTASASPSAEPSDASLDLRSIPESAEEEPEIVVHFEDWLAPGYGGPTSAPSVSSVPSTAPSSAPSVGF